MTRSITSIKFLFFFALSFLCSFILAQDAQPSSTKLTIYHQKDGDYIKRGEIIGLPGVPKYIPHVHEVVDFKSKKDDLYQIKIKDGRTGKVYLQSLKMCQMVANDWKDEFVLYLDNDNHFYAFNYYTGSEPCSESVKYPVSTKPFTSVVRVFQTAPAPKPLIGSSTTPKGQTNSRKPTVKVNDEIPDNKEIEEKSFFQKYWYIILGGALILLTAGSPPPEGPPAARR